MKIFISLEKWKGNAIIIYTTMQDANIRLPAISTRWLCVLRPRMSVATKSSHQTPYEKTTASVQNPIQEPDGGQESVLSG